MWYMNYANDIEIGAPASLVWDVFTDVERWPEWTTSVVEVTPLDGPAIAAGARFAIKQPRLPVLVWCVTDVTPGAAWVWRSRSLGVEAVAVHEVVPAGPDRTIVRQRLEQRGALAAVSNLAMRRRVRRYLALEAAGLRGRVEALHRSGTTPA
jgi:uncharacterized membrane protein